MENNGVEKVIIIGGGPSGLAAAIYNSRANLKPLVFAGSPPGGQLTLTSDVENFPGYESILGPELIERLRKQSLKFGTRIKDENVLELNLEKRPFTVRTLSAAYSSETILIATGAKALWLGLESETRLRGRGVSACATCDGFFFRNKAVAVVGGGDTALEEAIFLTRFASHVNLLHRSSTFRASKIMQERVRSNPKITVMTNTSIEEVLGQSKVEGIRIKQTNGESANEKISDFPLDGLFIAIGHKPDTDLFKGKVELDEKGYVITGAVAAQKAVDQIIAGTHDKYSVDYFKQFSAPLQYSTNVKGVFAAGDCVDYTYRQAATASGMGVAAAIEIERFLEMC